MKVWVLDKLFGWVKLGCMSVWGGFWCHLNDVHMTVYDYMYNRLLFISNCEVMLKTKIALKLCIQNYNFICIFTATVQTV
jgi:hypothetical protein